MSGDGSPGEAGSIRYGEELIRYRIRRQATRRSARVAIHVDAAGLVVVDASVTASDAEVRRAVTQRAGWIHEHVSASLRRRAFVLPREYVSGESLLYLGRRYRLKVVARPKNQPTVRVWSGYVETQVPTRSPVLVRAALEQWYRERARVVFNERLLVMAMALRWLKSLPSTHLRVMKVQWGSCSPAGRLTLNPHLVKAPRECIDYVLLHELCHLKEHNHGPGFYRLLERHLSDWRRRKSRLDEMAELLLNT